MTANPQDPRDVRGNTPPQRQRPIPADTFFVRLGIARHHAGHLTIREAAVRCGLNYASWANWEQGSTPRDLLGVVHAVSEGLDVDHDWLLYGGELTPSTGPNRRVTKRPGEATLRKPPRAVRPKAGRPSNRPDAGTGRTSAGPGPRRPVVISPLQVA